MAYDPRMLQQMGRMGLGMMAPQQQPFQQSQQQQRPPEWWEQPLPAQRRDQPADQSADPSQDPNAPKRPPQPSLMQMLMLGGRPTYSGTPRPGPAIQDSPWGWLGSVGGGRPR